MPATLPRSFTFRLWIGTACGVALMLAMVAHALHESRQQHIQQALVETYASAAVLESDLQQLLEKASIALYILKSEHERGALPGARQASSVERFAARLRQEIPDLHSLGLADADGAVVAGSNMPPAGTSLADRAYFRRLQKDRTDATIVSVPVNGRRTGAPVLVLARRIDDEAGRFAGLALATISVERLQRALGTVETGRDGVAALRGPDLEMVARWPVPEEGHESIVPPALRAIAEGKDFAASYHHVSPVDGVERVVSYRRLGRYGLHLTVGRSRAQYLAHFGRDATVTIALATVLVALAFAAALGLQRSWRRQREIESRLSRQVDTDELTGAASRRHFFRLAQAELDRQGRYGGPLSLLMIDIDHFKDVNDSHGHRAGDAVLRRLVAVCAEIVRRVDYVGRVGGEEFAILLPETGADQALGVADRLRAAVAASRVDRAEGTPIRVTVSVGVATVEKSRDNVDTLMSRADSALYEAKRGGRDRVCVAPVS